MWLFSQSCSIHHHVVSKPLLEVFFINKNDLKIWANKTLNIYETIYYIYNFKLFVI